MDKEWEKFSWFTKWAEGKLLRMNTLHCTTKALVGFSKTKS